MDRGERISYRVIERGTAVECSGGEQVGTVKRVMEVKAKDIFDGIVIATPRGDRFVDAPEVGEIYERVVLLKIDAEECSRLPKPGQNPAAIGLKPGDVAATKTQNLARRAWNRITGNY